MKVKQLALTLMRDRAFGLESPLVQILDGVLDGLEQELVNHGCMGCLRDRLTTWFNAAVEEGRLVTYRIDDLRVVNGEIEGTVLFMPQPIMNRVNLTFSVTDRDVRL